MLLVALLACYEADPLVGEQCALAQTTRIMTEDGATVALHRHARPGGPPVLLVHGIASNTRYWDLDARHSAAAWLADRGHDVWLLDLRGHGEALVTQDGDWQVSGWSVDDYGRHDVAAAVAHVRAVTGFAQVGYVGHSMGGMVGAIYLASGGAPQVSSFTTVGSPGAFSREDPLVGLARAGFVAGGATLLRFETRAYAAIAADVGDRLPVKLQERLYNPENYDPAVIPRMLTNIVSPMSRKEMQHFARMIEAERFQSFDGSVGYLDALKDTDLPVLSFVGLGDEVVPPARARVWESAFGGNVTVQECGRSTGMRHDYGHLDYALGEHAAEEVWPVLDTFLRAHPPAR
jgi:pimeloyl-ACP methyl ester carboxylesterase